MPQPNQHKPCPPKSEELIRAFKYYFALGTPDTQLVCLLKKHYDVARFGLSLKSIKRWRKELGLLSTRQQRHDINSISAAVDAIRAAFPSRGANTITKQLRLKHGIHVSRKTVSLYLQLVDPEGVQARRQRRFVRHRFYAAGINDIWAQDQHDKWGPRFGLWLHCGIDPFSGFNNWMHVWWTNKNPRLITKYFLDAVRELGAIPVTTQSDPGTENYGVANVQTLARHELDPTLADTLQHRWMSKAKNVKSEANWSVLRRDFTIGFELLFEED
ncbi:hypothetical protein HGRIS_009263 [Hohenbuehelia grisea]|uniref:Transposase n=1 Tax=Hohenbuehelia grisea TaxID=104357 RepID=A0ABR3J134_9AGAR